jgi:sigma-B regulation protein RsbU (phosphoserine phosphatase)
LDQGGHVLGAFCSSHYTQGEIELKSGDRLLLFTDGLTEAVNESGEEFGEERLRDLLKEQRHLSASDLKANILRTVKDFCGDDFHDDAALLVVAVE